MLRDLASVYRELPATAAAVPLFLLLPSAVEAAQHLVEVRLGVFAAGGGGAGEAAGSSLRQGVALVKVAAVVGTALLVVRWRLHDRSRGRAFSFGRPALAHLAAGGAVVGLVAAATLFLGPVLARAATGLGGPGLGTVAFYTPVLVFTVLISRYEWIVQHWIGMVVGDPRMTRKAARSSGGGGPGWMPPVLLVAAVGPASALHLALNLGPVGLDPTVLAPLLGIDSLLVGAIAILMGNGFWVLYRRGRPAPQAAGECGSAG